MFGLNSDLSDHSEGAREGKPERELFVLFFFILWWESCARAEGERGVRWWKHVR